MIDKKKCIEAIKNAEDIRVQNNLVGYIRITKKEAILLLENEGVLLKGEVVYKNLDIPGTTIVKLILE